MVKGQQRFWCLFRCLSCFISCIFKPAHKLYSWCCLYCSVLDLHLSRDLFKILVGLQTNIWWFFLLLGVFPSFMLSGHHSSGIFGHFGPYEGPRLLPKTFALLIRFLWTQMTEWTRNNVRKLCSSLLPSGQFSLTNETKQMSTFHKNTRSKGHRVLFLREIPQRKLDLWLLLWQEIECEPWVYSPVWTLKPEKNGKMEVERVRGNERVHAEGTISF